MTIRRLLCILLTMAALSGAAGAEEARFPEADPAAPDLPVPICAYLAAPDRGFTEFDSALIASLEQGDYKEESYMVSPLSLRAALALAAAGAQGETREELLRAMGFESVQEMDDWYQTVLDSVDRFEAELQEERHRLDLERGLGLPLPGLPAEEKPDRAFSIANSVWRNTDRGGPLSPEYIRLAGERYRAAAEEASSGEITRRVNGWVNDRTHGMIPSIADDLSETAAVLVNALYLRTGWRSAFLEGATAPGLFTTIRGEQVEKEFMHQRSAFPYYEDPETQLVVLPMAGDIYAAFVLGSTEGIGEKLWKAQREEVSVTLPKFELESSFTRRELPEFLRSRGAVLAFERGRADFTLMSPTGEWFIDDILQKTKIKVDEEGIEAAAVTAITMKATSTGMEPPPPKVFRADRPFSFYLYTSAGGTRELLFCGRLTA